MRSGEERSDGLCAAESFGVSNVINARFFARRRSNTLAAGKRVEHEDEVEKLLDDLERDCLRRGFFGEMSNADTSVRSVAAANTAASFARRRGDEG